MGLLDWARSSLLSQNRIEAGRKRTVTTDTPADPETVTRSYYAEGKGRERRYYDDYRKQSLAITATPDRIQSRRNDLQTIRAMLALAEARGWTEIRVTGNAEFRREAWIEATARGLTVSGHRSSEPERQEAERRRNERTRFGPQTMDRPDTARSQGAQRAVSDQVSRRGQGGSEHDLHRAKARDTATTARAFAEPAALSADGRLILAALSSKIDRQMAKLSSEARAEVKAFAVAELVRRERRDGAVVVTEAERAMARAPRPDRASPSPPPRRASVEPPRLVRGR